MAWASLGQIFTSASLKIPECQSCVINKVNLKGMSAWIAATRQIKEAIKGLKKGKWRCQTSLQNIGPGGGGLGIPLDSTIAVMGFALALHLFHNKIQTGTDTRDSYLKSNDDTHRKGSIYRNVLL